MTFPSPFRNLAEHANLFAQQEQGTQAALPLEIAMQLEGAKFYDLAQPPRADAGTTIIASGTATVAPFITQGFLLDVAHFKGGSLADGYAVTAADLDGAMRAQGRLIMPGGVILVRTSFGQFWHEPAKYMNVACLSPDALRWLREKNPHAIGADSGAWDASAHESATIIANLNLEGLAADHVDHFLFIAAPINQMVRPLAIEVQAQSDFMQP
ncbi:MAG: cyclase family protein [Chloroflexota bacterium]